MKNSRPNVKGITFCRKYQASFFTETFLEVIKVSGKKKKKALQNEQ